MKLEEFISDSNINNLKSEYQQKIVNERLEEQKRQEKYRLEMEKSYLMQKPIIKSFIENVWLPNAKFDGKMITLPKIHYTYSKICHPCGKNGEWLKEYYKINCNNLHRYLKENMDFVQIKKTEEGYTGCDDTPYSWYEYTIDPEKIPKNFNNQEENHQDATIELGEARRMKK